MKFNEYQYVRPNMKDVEKRFLEAIEVIKNSTDMEKVSFAFEAINKVRRTVSTMEGLVYVRHSINTNDEFYAQEKAFFDENMPIYESYANQLSLVLVSCPLTKELEEKYGKKFFNSVRTSLKTFKPEIIEDLQE